MRNAVLYLIIGITFAVNCRSAQAVAQFGKFFNAKYVTDNDNEEFVKKAKKARCWVCHQGKKRKYHNPYGIHLVKFLDRKKDLKNEERAFKALETVAKMHIDPEDEESPTYGELIKEGKLPGGTLEEAKKEPEDYDEADKRNEDAKKEREKRRAKEEERKKEDSGSESGDDEEEKSEEESEEKD